MAKKKAENQVELIWVEKDGIKLQIHPTTLKSHQEVGWKVCEQLTIKAPEVAEEEPSYPDEGV